MSTIKTACLCDSLEMEIDGAPVAQLYCHCDDCQATCTAAYVGVSIHAAANVRITRGEPSSWTYKTTARLRCPNCGTMLFSDLTDLGLRGVRATLLPAEAFKPSMHIQCQFAVLPVKDQLPHFRAFPAAFGGTDETVDW